jgi:hypothetical protein
MNDHNQPDQLIDQVIAALLAAPDAMRRGHPLLAAIAAALGDAPDDQADLDRFVAAGSVNRSTCARPSASDSRLAATAAMSAFGLPGTLGIGR